MEAQIDFYTSSNYHIVKAFIVSLLTIAVTIALLIFTCKKLQAPGAGIVGWILICSVPFLFKKKVKILFSTKTNLKFSNKGVLITEYKDKEILINEYFVNWDNVKSYRFQFMNDNITNINLKFKNTSHKAFFFINEQYTNEFPNEISIYSLFIKYIKLYNSDKVDADKILTKRNTFSIAKPDL